jgi:hypothetical protein
MTRISKDTVCASARKASAANLECSDARDNGHPFVPPSLILSRSLSLSLSHCLYPSPSRYVRGKGEIKERRRWPAMRAERDLGSARRNPSGPSPLTRAYLVPRLPAGSPDVFQRAPPKAHLVPTGTCASGVGLADA